MKILSGVGCCILLYFVILVNADGIIEHKELREKCRDESKLTDDDIKLATTISSNLGCYLFCFLNDLDVMDDEGNFDPAAATNAVDDDLREASRPGIYSCYDSYKSIFDGDACKTALEITRCFQERARNLYELMGIFELAVQ